jgi:hypothetical protein
MQSAAVAAVAMNFTPSGDRGIVAVHTHAKGVRPVASCCETANCAYDGNMPKAPEPEPELHLKQIIFHENVIAEIHFADGREVVWSGGLAADLRSAVQVAVKRGFLRAQRGSSGPNSIAN